jgi:hypothetical protein
MKDLPFLEGLTGSPLRARMLRLFLREPQLTFRLTDVSHRIGMPLPSVRREAKHLEGLGILKLSRGAKRAQVLMTSPFVGELRTIVLRSFPIGRADLLKILSLVGSLRLVVVSGIFLNAERTRADLLVVAYRYSERRMEGAVKRIEEVIGSEVRWAGMEVKEFLYRWNMFDRFVRDILTQPHEKILEKVKF